MHCNFTYTANCMKICIWAIKQRESAHEEIKFSVVARKTREPRFYFLNTRAFMNMRKFIEAYPRPTFR